MATPTSPCPCSCSKSVPDAPERKKQRDFMTMPFWEVLRRRGNVRSRYCHYTPADVEEIDDKDTLKEMSDIYCVVHSAQPRNEEEWAYISLMRDCLMKKFWKL